jgi:hypothetical protein
MITIVDLQTSLLDLLYEIEGSEIKVIIGGGFGIYLKAVHFLFTDGLRNRHKTPSANVFVMIHEPWYILFQPLQSKDETNMVSGHEP